MKCSPYILFYCLFFVLPLRSQQQQKDEENKTNNQLQRVTVILELLQHKINIEEPHRLLLTLFGTLTRYMVQCILYVVCNKADIDDINLMCSLHADV